MSIFQSALGLAKKPADAYAHYYHFALFKGVSEPDKIADALFVRAFEDVYVNRDMSGLWTRKDGTKEQLEMHELAATKRYMTCLARPKVVVGTD